jgi:hypothetical protein
MKSEYQVLSRSVSAKKPSGILLAEGFLSTGIKRVFVGKCFDKVK